MNKYKLYFNQINRLSTDKLLYKYFLLENCECVCNSSDAYNKDILMDKIRMELRKRDQK